MKKPRDKQPGLTRRQFLGTSAGAASLLTAGQAGAQESHRPDLDEYGMPTQSTAEIERDGLIRQSVEGAPQTGGDNSGDPESEAR